MKHRTNFVRSALLVLMATALAMAQSDRGTVTGNVTDPSDAGIQAAKLALRNIATGALMETQTTPTGNYTFVSVPVGTYDLTVEASGLRRRWSGR